MVMVVVAVVWYCGVVVVVVALMTVVRVISLIVCNCYSYVFLSG